MQKPLSRRRVLTLLGAGAAFAGTGLALPALRAEAAPVRWSGEVMGATASMTLWHPRPDHARRTIARMLTEVGRLDAVFSLYRADSELVRLNSEGRLDRPSRDLALVLGRSLVMAEQSQGAFDPSIQPLWQHHSTAPGTPVPAGVLARVGWQKIDSSPRQIGFSRPGMALSLNGIAQGYITDRISDLLANEGFEQAMIELGETRALGQGQDGPFDVGLVDPFQPGLLARSIPLAGEALAVSGGYGLRLGAGHHIFTPQTGASPQSLVQVAVTAPTAMLADALSTALYVAGPGRAADLLAAHPGTRALLWHASGQVTEA